MGALAKRTYLTPAIVDAMQQEGRLTVSAIWGLLNGHGEVAIPDDEPR